MSRRRRLSAWRLAPLAGVALLTTEPAAAAPSPPARATVMASAEQLLGMAEDLVRRGAVDQAEAVLKLMTRDPSPIVRSEARFRLARLNSSAGRLADAAVLLRRILDDQPNAAPVRLELAATLQKMGDEGAALRELRALRSANLPVGVARFVDRLSASLQATKPLGVHFEFALAPDSNINRATRSDTLGTVFGDFSLDPDSKARSGIGAAMRGIAHARLPVTGNMNLVAKASGDASLYRHKKFNDISLDIAAGPEFRIGRTRLSAEVGAGQQWFGMKPYQRSLRLGGSASRPIGSVSQVHLDVGARWSDNRFNDLQDGHGLTVRARYERALSPEMLVAASIGGDRFKAKDGAYSTRSWNAGFAAYRDVGRMTLSAGIEIGRLEADERLQLLPKVREDKLIRFSLGAVFRHFTVGGFAPMTRLVIERNRSSVEFYDYQRTRTEFGVSRAF